MLATSALASVSARAPFGRAMLIAILFGVLINETVKHQAGAKARDRSALGVRRAGAAFVHPDLRCFLKINQIIQVKYNQKLK